MNTVDHLTPMLASPGVTPPTGPGWAFEFKWDGLRALAAVTPDGDVRLTSRNGINITSSFPELAVLVEAVGGRPVVLDGEIVALDSSGQPDIGLLQRRMGVRSPSRALLDAIPVCFFAFDVISVGGTSVTQETYLRRRELLYSLVDADATTGPIRVPLHFTDIDGAVMLDIARQHGIEGIVGKRLGSRYELGRRSATWVKTVLRDTQEVVVCGWRTGTGRELGALIMGAHDSQGKLVYLGDVGSGFTEATLADLLGHLKLLEQQHSPFGEPVDAPGAHWTAPELVGEVTYRTRSKKGRLRYPAWRGLRIDKTPQEVVIVNG